jgi:cytochrome c oxidase assembly protein subunit 11
MRKLPPKKKKASTKISKNDRMLFGFAIFVGLMIGLSYASVPLYSIFCKATGFGGTPLRVTEASTAAPAAQPSTAQSAVDPKTRTITVAFDGNVDPALPWDFTPETRSVNVKLGEQVTVKYRAHNRGNTDVVGTATYNVQPDRAGAYFDKIQCFCFTKQVLKAGQSAELPVTFYIDPALAKDKQNDDVQNITLSYTFFRAKDQSLARKAHRGEPAYQDPDYPPYN